MADKPVQITPKPPQTDEDWNKLKYEALELFSPGAPIDELSLLAGRASQISKLIEAVMQRGQHAILYGERGVGKSSLANTFSTKLIGVTRTLVAPVVNCHPSDDFSAVWRKVFRRLEVEGQNLAQKYPAEITPDDVVIELSGFSLNTLAIIILDEFDKLADEDAKTLIANTIKNLSDHSVRATVVVVGVSNTVEGLINEHESVLRCLRQIPIQRMNATELKQIINRRLPDLGMAIRDDALAHIVALSRGLPHYTHLFGQRAAIKALDEKTTVITLRHVDMAMPECIGQTAQSVREQYHKATISPRSGNIYKEVLLAAALASADDLGYFAPGDLCKPLGELLQKEAKVSLFGQHLKNLCDPDRGVILEQVGSERRYRYRFAEPMMQPFVLMRGLRDGLITREQVNALAASHYEPKFSSDF